jgi:3-oxoacyl-[acyl-carrier-protein] synthase-3
MTQITANKVQNIQIVSTGLFLPPKIQTSGALAPLIGRSEKWIISRTGISERRIAEEPMDVMAAKAAREALGKGRQPDCILNASTTPLQLLPDSSVFIQKELGMSGIPSWSVHATCLSFVVALLNASALIQTKTYRKILVVSSETGTPWRNLKEPESAALFGDGAAAAVIEPTPQGAPSCLLDWEMNSWPDGADYTEFRGAGTRHPPDNPEKTKPEDNLFHMEGSAVYRMARERIAITLSAILNRNKLQPKDIDWVIPHQASGRAVEAASEYGFQKNQVVNIIAEYGNCIAASIPMALAIMHKRGLLKRGQLLLLGGTGAGLSVAFALIRW